MVSPVYKAGYGLTEIQAVAPNGESAAFSSIGAFDGSTANQLFNPYLARREGEKGWSSGPLNAPATEWPFSEIADFSPSLDVSLSKAMPGANSGTLNEGDVSEFLTLSSTRPNMASDFEAIGEPLILLHHSLSFNVKYDTADPSFAHVVFDVKPEQNLLPQANGTESRLYDLSSAGLKLVGLNNKGKPITGCLLINAGSYFGRGSTLNAVSKDGQEIFFMVGTTETSGQCSEHEQVFVRLGGSRTIEISRPVNASKKFGGCEGEASGTPGEVPCAGATSRLHSEYQGASEDGAEVFFTTREPLATGKDVDLGNDLYMARVECPEGGLEGCAPAAREVRSLVQVSQAAEPADVQGVVAVSRDGSHIYLVAQGVLSGANPTGHAPIEGADNLYSYDPRAGAEPVFVADLCSGPEESGNVRDTGCPSSSASDDSALWQQATRKAQLNECALKSTFCGDGRFLIFTTYAKLLASDTDSAQDVYRYDAASYALERVSGGEDGYDANGNDAHDATIANGIERGTIASQYNSGVRAVSEDGLRVIFFTAEPLSPAAGNGLVNLYEWDESTGGEGRVALVSSGSSDQPVDHSAISSNGRDIFFLTTQGLTAEDTDGQVDLYDAREGGGKPAAGSALQVCSGDACQGPLTTPPPVLVPGSASVTPGDNFASLKPRPSGKTTKKKQHSKKQHSKKQHSKKQHSKRRRKTVSRQAHRSRGKQGGGR